jgi:hypothetical protein
LLVEWAELLGLDVETVRHEASALTRQRSARYREIPFWGDLLDW